MHAPSHVSPTSQRVPEMQHNPADFSRELYEAHARAGSRCVEERRLPKYSFENNNILVHVTCGPKKKASRLSYMPALPLTARQW